MDEPCLKAAGELPGALPRRRPPEGGEKVEAEAASGHIVLHVDMPALPKLCIPLTSTRTLVRFAAGIRMLPIGCCLVLSGMRKGDIEPLYIPQTIQAACFGLLAGTSQRVAAPKQQRWTATPLALTHQVPSCSSIISSCAPARMMFPSASRQLSSPTRTLPSSMNTFSLRYKSRASLAPASVFSIPGGSPIPDRKDSFRCNEHILCLGGGLLLVLCVKCPSAVISGAPGSKGPDQPHFPTILTSESMTEKYRCLSLRVAPFLTVPRPASCF